MSEYILSCCSTADLSKEHFEKRDIKDFKKYSEKGTVICNPPYGERLLDLQEAQKLYKEMGRVFDKAHGWSYYIITPDEEFEQCFGRKADKRRQKMNELQAFKNFMIDASNIVTETKRITI